MYYTNHLLHFFPDDNVLSSSAEILSSALTLHIYLTILVSVLFSLISSYYLTGQVSLPDSISGHTHTHTQHDLSSAGNDKPLLANNGTKSLNFLHTFQPLWLLLRHLYNKTFHNFKKLANYLYASEILCYVSLMTCSCLTFKSSFSLLPITKFFCTQHLQNWQKMELLHPFCKQHKKTCLLL